MFVNTGKYESLEDWYINQCDENWEHIFGITIETLDNPGWSIDINLEDTDAENNTLDRFEDFRTENNWVTCWRDENQFRACGGPLNLAGLIELFLRWVNEESVGINT